jgi:nicotinate-nucleotide--dimethylbenzimidazole phosphoribosyltransferase
MQNIFERVASIAPLDTGAMELARSRQQQLTKPAGSLGRLEDIAIQIAGITKQLYCFPTS